MNGSFLGVSIAKVSFDSKVKETLLSEFVLKLSAFLSQRSVLRLKTAIIRPGTSQALLNSKLLPRTDRSVFANSESGILVLSF